MRWGRSTEQIRAPTDSCAEFVKFAHAPGADLAPSVHRQPFHQSLPTVPSGVQSQARSCWTERAVQWPSRLGPRGLLVSGSQQLR